MDEKLRSIYDTVSQDYDLKDFGSFSQAMLDREKRKLFFNAVSSDYDLRSFDEFSNAIYPELVSQDYLTKGMKKEEPVQDKNGIGNAFDNLIQNMGSIPQTPTMYKQDTTPTVDAVTGAAETESIGEPWKQGIKQAAGIPGDVLKWYENLLPELKAPPTLSKEDKKLFEEQQFKPLSDVAQKIYDYQSTIDAKEPLGKYADSPETLWGYLDPKRIYMTMASNIPQMAGYMATTLINPYVGFLTMAASEGGSSVRAIEEWEQQTGKKVPEEYKKLMPAVVGALNGALELVGVESILKAGDIPGLKGKILEALLATATEGTTEGLQEVNSILGESGYREIAPEEWMRVFESFYAGTLLGMAGAGSSVGIKIIKDINTEQKPDDQPGGQLDYSKVGGSFEESPAGKEQQMEEAKNAESLRENEGQIQERGTERPGGKEKSGENIQQQAKTGTETSNAEKTPVKPKAEWDQTVSEDETETRPTDVVAEVGKEKAKATKKILDTRKSNIIIDDLLDMPGSEQRNPYMADYSPEERLAAADQAKERIKELQKGTQEYADMVGIESILRQSATPPKEGERTDFNIYTRVEKIRNEVNQVPKSEESQKTSGAGTGQIVPESKSTTKAENAAERKFEPIKDKAGLQKKLKAEFNYSDKESESSATVVDAAMDYFAKKTGKSKEELYAENIEDITRSPQETAQRMAAQAGLFQEQQQAPVFYSKLERVIDEKMPNRADPESIRNMINKSGVKQEEIDFTGLDEFLKDKKSVSKEELQEFIAENQVRVEEVVKEQGKGEYNVTIGDEQEIKKDTMVKFAQYTEPGGENYRELLLTLPSGLAKDAPNLNYKMNDILRENDNLGFGTFQEAKRAVVERPTGWDVDKEAEYIFKLYSQAMKSMENVYKSGHFEEPNILAHIRFNERTDADGNKVLFIEEIQSDWHQEGRKKGYQTNKKYTKSDLEIYKNPLDDRWIVKIKDIGQSYHFGTKEQAEKESEGILKDLNSGRIKSGGVPDAPFKKTWQDLALKRALRWAAENGFDKVAWTTGEMQAERYDLSKQVDRITYQETKSYDENNRVIPEETTYTLQVIKNGNTLDHLVNADINKVEEYVGKEIAEKIKNGVGEDTKITNERGQDMASKALSGLDLKVGGEGMKAFYDKMLVNSANKIGKKFGAKVKEIIVGERKSEKVVSGFVVNGLDITPSMRSSLLTEGQPLFQKMKGGVEFLKNGKALIHAFERADVSTGMHEFAHVFLKMMDKYNLYDKQVVLDWAGAKTITTDVQEKFARGFEKYLRDGKAPTEALKRVFENFKQWLREIYTKVKNSPIDIKLTPEMRDLFDALLGGEKTRTKKSEQTGQLDLFTAETSEEVDQAMNQFSARKADIAEDRKTLGLDGIASPERKKWAESLQNAKNRKLDQKAVRIASEIVQKPRALNDEETAGLALQGMKLKNEYKSLLDKIKNANDNADIEWLSSEIQRVESEFDLLTYALRISGTEKGRALVSQKLTIDQDFDLISVKSRAKAAKGKELTEKESERFNELIRKLDDSNQRIDELQKKINEMTAQSLVKEGSVKRYRKMNLEAKDAELNGLLAKAKQLLAEGC